MTTEELKEKLAAAFPGQLGGVVRPDDPIESDHDFFTDLPQLISKDPVIYDKMNLILSVLLSNDKQLHENAQTSAKDISLSEDGDEIVITKGDGTTSSVTITNIDTVYPVGSVYISVLETNPGELFGGTWEEMPAGRVLLAQGTSEWETTYTAGETGGEATHTLTTDEMPSHTHTGSTASAGEHTHSYTKYNCLSWSGSKSATSAWQDTESGTTGSAGSHTHTMNLDSTGGGSAHNNMPPYLAVYMWKRTA